MTSLQRGRWPAGLLPWPICAVLGVFLLLKLLILAVYGPISAEDTNGYRFVADAIDRGSEFWTSAPDWWTAALSGYVFRPIGYPLLLSTFHNDTALILCQIAASALVAVLLCRLVFEATGSVRYGALAGAFYLGGYSVLIDTTLLSDGLYVPLFNIVVLTLLRAGYGTRPIGAGGALALGLLWGYSIWTRESGAFLTVIPLALLADRRLAPDRAGALSWARFRPMAAFMAPVVVMVGLYVGWNAYRTGEVFLGITGTANYLRPAFDIATASTADPFDDDSVLSTTVKWTMPDFGFPAQFAFFQTMQDETHLSPVGLKGLFFKKFTETIIHHPLAYAEIVAKNLNPVNFGSLLFNPLFTLNDFFQLGVPPHRRIIPGAGLKSWKTLLSERDWVGAALAAASGVGVLGSTTLFLAMLVGLPLQAVRNGLTPRLALGLKSLGIFVVVAVAFALLHTEARLIAPAIPAGLVAAAIAAASRPARVGATRTAPAMTQGG